MARQFCIHDDSLYSAIQREITRSTSGHAQVCPKHGILGDSQIPQIGVHPVLATCESVADIRFLTFRRDMFVILRSAPSRRVYPLIEGESALVMNSVYSFLERVVHGSAPTSIQESGNGRVERVLHTPTGESYEKRVVEGEYVIVSTRQAIPIDLLVTEETTCVACRQPLRGTSRFGHSRRVTRLACGHTQHADCCRFRLESGLGICSRCTHGVVV